MTTFFISCDWGTSRLRLRLVELQGRRVATESLSDEGVARIASSSTAVSRAARFASALTSARERLSKESGHDADDAPLVISGMASSSIGWHELPYAELPFTLDAAALVWHKLEQAGGSRGNAYLLSGVRSKDDVMRGEEAELIGLADYLGHDKFPARCTVIMPGTHSKHVEVVNNAARGFRTFMTGELFEVLRTHSVLRGSTGGDSGAAAAFDENSFSEGCLLGAKEPLSSTLFRVRARQLLNGCGISSNSSYLSGLLVGAELGGLTSSDSSLLLCAGGKLENPYTLAVNLLGMGTRATVVPAAVVDTLAARGHAVFLEARGLEENG